ncbi:ferrous iron transport protein A [Schnuerera sp. xch1]|uniref:FeoA family protein n=1 Tax=Schnuerera sp. xch1 TaxID=2874283 RepID=UPI001CBC0F83|nr:FeoA family protein [Schnuerera sp. xch1]MBZ2174238.1 ferrous iron transport protein A [Schnuerera sp. xch1]
MNKNLISLDRLPTGSFGIVKKLSTQGTTRRRMLDLGMIYDTKVESLRKSPAGDPIAYQVRGAVIALRSEEASKIFVESIYRN